MATQIIGDGRKRNSRYDPNLARRLNEEIEERRKKTELEEQRKKEKERKAEEARKIIIPGLEDICESYKEYMALDGKTKMKLSEFALTLRFKPSSQQISEFCKALVSYSEIEEFEYHTSFYLSGLMYASGEDSFVLDFTELNKTGKVLYQVGVELKGKKLQIKGDVGDELGYNMDASEIFLEGNALEGVGRFAKDSKITIEGNVGDGIGYMAYDCDINIKGTYKGLSEGIEEGTRVYHWENAKWVRIHPTREWKNK